MIKLAAASGGAAEIPLAVTVLPFRLEHPEHATHGLFYYTDNGSYSPFELMDMRDHGMDTAVAGLLPRGRRARTARSSSTRNRRAPPSPSSRPGIPLTAHHAQRRAGGRDKQVHGPRGGVGRKPRGI